LGSKLNGRTSRFLAMAFRSGSDCFEAADVETADIVKIQQRQRQKNPRDTRKVEEGQFIVLNPYVLDLGI
jgi:hypothetical protein